MNTAQTMSNPAQAMLNPARTVSNAAQATSFPAWSCEGICCGLGPTSLPVAGLMIALVHLLSLARHNQDPNIYCFGGASAREADCARHHVTCLPMLLEGL